MTDDPAVDTTRLAPAVQFALLAGPLLSMLDSSIINVAVAPIARELNASVSSTQWAVSAYLLALGIGLTYTGYLGRKFGTLRVYALSVLIFTLASALCAIAPSIEFLIGARILQGLAGAPMVPLAMTMLLGQGGTTRKFSPLAGILLFLGPALGPTVGGLLIGAGGWRAIFLINLPIGALAALATRQIPRRLAPAAQPGATLDVIGLLMLMTGLGALLFGASEGPALGWSDSLSWTPLVAGVVLLGLFGWRAIHHDQPVLDLHLVRFRTSILALLLCGFASVITYAALVLLPLFAQAVQHHDALSTGLALLPQGIVTGLSLALGQRLLTRISMRAAASLGFLLLATASGGLLLIGPETPLWVTSLILAARAAALGLIITPLLGALLEPVHAEKLPDANSIFSIWQRIAGSLGIGIAVSLYANQAQTAGATGALHLVGGGLIGLAGISLLFALLLPRTHNKVLDDR